MTNQTKDFSSTLYCLFVFKTEAPLVSWTNQTVTPSSGRTDRRTGDAGRGFRLELSLSLDAIALVFTALTHRAKAVKTDSDVLACLTASVLEKVAELQTADLDNILKKQQQPMKTCVMVSDEL